MYHTASTSSAKQKYPVNHNSSQIQGQNATIASLPESYGMTISNDQHLVAIKSPFNDHRKSSAKLEVSGVSVLEYCNWEKNKQTSVFNKTSLLLSTAGPKGINELIIHKIDIKEHQRAKIMTLDLHVRVTS